jgi:hypothetical protein
MEEDPNRMPRCCDKASDEFEPCYASVLVAGAGLQQAVEDAEELAPICPCVTVWCAKCRRCSFAVGDRRMFPCASAQLAHALVVRGLVEDTLATLDSK